MSYLSNKEKHTKGVLFWIVIVIAIVWSLLMLVPVLYNFGNFNNANFFILLSNTLILLSNTLILLSIIGLINNIKQGLYGLWAGTIISTFGFYFIFGYMIVPMNLEAISYIVIGAVQLIISLLVTVSFRRIFKKFKSTSTNDFNRAKKGSVYKKFNPKAIRAAGNSLKIIGLLMLVSFIFTLIPSLLYYFADGLKDIQLTYMVARFCGIIISISSIAIIYYMISAGNSLINSNIEKLEPEDIIEKG